MSDRPICADCDRPMHKYDKTASGRQRWRCQGCMRSTTNVNDDFVKGYDENQITAQATRTRKAWRGGTKRFIVTSATNNVDAHRGFLTALESAADHLDAALVVIPVHYKNISLYMGGEEYKKTWDPAITPYIVDQEIKLPGLVIDGETNIQATAADPLSGMHDIGGSSSWRIFGHPQMSMLPVAMPANKMPKRIYTTGSVSEKSYSRTKQGKRGEFHHTMAALLVEYQGRTPFIRQINCDQEGGFYDLDKYFSADGKVTSGHRITVLATGDEHEKFMCKKVKNATYLAEDSIVKTLRPEWIVRHDVFDAYAISHHHLKSPLIQYRKSKTGDGHARQELEGVVRLLNETTPEGSTNVLVSANHHDHLDRWLDRASANTDHDNAHLILELQKAQREAVDRGESPAALPLYLKDRVTVPLVILDRNEPFIPNPGLGADYSQHGDVGPNGSRGSARAMSKSALKMTLGHSHSAQIIKGVYQVGKSTGRLEYENGLSTHSNTHCLEYANGKRTLIDIIGGRWRANLEGKKNA